VDPASRGMDGWQGIRTRRVRKPFPDVNGIADKRGTFGWTGVEYY
jgi:hypothetical protein